jgi:trk system potassium uptake protein TrkA
MFVLVVGGGKLGSNLAQTVRAEGHELVVVELDRKRASQLANSGVDAEVVQGDGCEPAVLERAHVGRADVVVAVTGDDEDNLVVCLLAKREYGVKTTLARINDPRNEWLFDARFGVDVSVSNTRIMAQLLTEEVGLGHIVTCLGLVREGVALVQLEILPGAIAIDRPLSELGVPADARLVAVVRDGHILVPGPDIRLQVRDEVLAVASVESEGALRAALVGG